MEEKKNRRKIIFQQQSPTVIVIYTFTHSSIHLIKQKVHTQKTLYNRVSK